MKHRIVVLSLLLCALVLSTCSRNVTIVDLGSSGPWTRVGGLTQFNNIAASDAFLFAGGQSRLFRSSDNGMSWSADTSLSSGDYTVAVMNGAVFAGEGSLRKGVFVSTDNGLSWSERDTGLILGPGEYRVILSFLARGPGVFAGTDQGIYKSNDFGAHWAAVNIGINPTIIYSFAAIGSRIFAGVQWGTFMSPDDGGNWMLADSGLTNNNIFPGEVLPVVSFAANDGKIFAGTIGAQIFRSTNYGTNWTNVTGGLPSYGQSGMFLAMNGSTLYAGYDAGVFLSTNGGSSWTKITDNLSSPIITGLALTNNYLFAGSNDGTVWRRAL